MSCEKHKLRKRPATCPDCANDELEAGHATSERLANTDDEHLPPVTGNGNAKRETGETVKKHVKVAIDKEALEIIDNVKEAIAGSRVEKNEGFPRHEEGKYVRVLIEAEIQKALAKVRQEMNELRNIQWEHLDVNYSTFCLALMYALEKEGWKFCDFLKNPKQYGYAMTEDCVVFQRIKRKDNPPRPDFTKTGSVGRYMDKVNGKETKTES